MPPRSRAGALEHCPCHLTTSERSYRSPFRLRSVRASRVGRKAAGSVSIEMAFTSRCETIFGPAIDDARDSIVFTNRRLSIAKLAVSRAPCVRRIPLRRMNVQRMYEGCTPHGSASFRTRIQIYIWLRTGIRTLNLAVNRSLRPVRNDDLNSPSATEYHPFTTVIAGVAVRNGLVRSTFPLGPFNALIRLTRPHDSRLPGTATARSWKTKPSDVWQIRLAVQVKPRRPSAIGDDLPCVLNSFVARAGEELNPPIGVDANNRPPNEAASQRSPRAPGSARRACRMYWIAVWISQPNASSRPSLFCATATSPTRATPAD